MMDHSIPTDVTQIPNAEAWLPKRLEALIGMLEPEYRAWLAYNGTPITVVANTPDFGSFNEEDKTIYLNVKVVSGMLPLSGQLFVLREEIVHMMDYYLRFSAEKDFITAVQQDGEELGTKTLLAVSRVWHQCEKPLPTAKPYEQLGHTDREFLPDTLAAKSMLLALGSSSNGARLRMFMQQTGEANRSTESAYMDMETKVISHVFGYHDSLSPLRYESAIQFAEGVKKRQPSQYEEMRQVFRSIVSNPEGRSAEQMLAEYIPNLYSQAGLFQQKAGEILKWQQPDILQQVLSTAPKKGQFELTGLAKAALQRLQDQSSGPAAG